MSPPTKGAGNRPPLARHAAHRQPPAAPRARLRRSQAAPDRSAIADAALAMLDVDAGGLDLMDRKLLAAVIDKFGGGPVGVDNLAAAIGERDTIEDVLEPYLIQQGYLQRTPRGRVATRRSTATSAWIRWRAERSLWGRLNHGSRPARQPAPPSCC